MPFLLRSILAVQFLPVFIVFTHTFWPRLQLFFLLLSLGRFGERRGG